MCQFVLFFLYSDTAAAVFVPMQLSSVIVALYSNCHYCSVPMQHCCVIVALSTARIVNLYEGILAIHVVGSLWHIAIVNKAFRLQMALCETQSTCKAWKSLCVPPRKRLQNRCSEIAFCANFDLLADKLNIKRIQRIHNIKFSFTGIAAIHHNLMTN